MKFPFVFAALLAGSVVLAGCSDTSAPKDISLESAPIVVVSEPTASTVNTHAHNCSDPNVLCGTVTNGLFEDSQRIFQMKVPEGWDVRGSELSGDAMVIGGSSGRSFLEISRTQPNPNLFAYTQDDFQRTYQEGVSDFRFLSFEKTSVQNLPAVHLVYEYSENGTAYHFNQFILSGTYDYSVTMIRPVDEPDRSEEFQQLIATFQQLSTPDPAKQNQGKLVGTLYTASDSAYTITLPEGWRIDPEQDHMSAVSADRSAALQILVNAPDAKLLETSQEQLQQYYAKRYSDVQVSVFEKVSISGASALHLVCSYQDNAKTVTAEQFLIPVASHTYTLTFTKTGSATDPLFATAAQSFQLA